MLSVYIRWNAMHRKFPKTLCAPYQFWRWGTGWSDDWPQMVTPNNLIDGEASLEFDFFFFGSFWLHIEDSGSYISWAGNFDWQITSGLFCFDVVCFFGITSNFFWEVFEAWEDINNWSLNVFLFGSSLILLHLLGTLSILGPSILAFDKDIMEGTRVWRSSAGWLLIFKASFREILWRSSSFKDGNPSSTLFLTDSNSWEHFK